VNLRVLQAFMKASKVGWHSLSLVREALDSDPFHELQHDGSVKRLQPTVCGKLKASITLDDFLGIPGRHDDGDPSTGFHPHLGHVDAPLPIRRSGEEIVPRRGPRGLQSLVRLDLQGLNGVRCRVGSSGSITRWSYP